MSQPLGHRAPARLRRPAIGVYGVIVASLMLSLTPACTRPSTPGTGAAIRTDSAGTEMVRNTGYAWKPGQEWRIDPEPFLDIPPAGAGYELNRISFMARLPNQGVVLANRGSNQLLVFDGSGHLRRTVGRQGAGPGEFAGIGMVQLVHADTVVVYDFTLRRLSFFRSTGDLVADLPSPPNDSAIVLTPFGRLADGTWLETANPSYPSSTPPGVRVDSFKVFRVDHSLTTVLALVAMVPTSPMLVLVPPGYPERRTTTNLPFTMGASFLVHDSLLYLVHLQDGMTERINPRTGQRMIIELGLPLAPVTPKDLARERDEERQQTPPDQQGLLEEKYRHPAIPKTKPLLALARIDSEGYLWLRRWEVGADSRVTYIIVAPDGELLGEVAAPPGLRVMAIEPDAVIGIYRDADDLESVRSYRLTRTR